MSGNMTRLRERPEDQWIEGLRARYPTEPSIEQALTRKLQLRGSGDYCPPTLEVVRERLERFLTRETCAAVTVRNLARLTGGASKEQYVFELDSHDGAGHRSERMVLRCQPGVSIVETSRRREFELMGFAAALMPVPPVYWLDEKGDTLGTPSLISGFVPGSQKSAQVVSNVSGVGIHFPARYRALLAPQYVRHMAVLHSARPAQNELPSFVRPAVGTTEAAELLVNWWGRVWAEDLYEDVPVATLAELWLRNNMPLLQRLAVVHGDFRAGNFLFDENTGQITAMLDWEMGCLGDHHGDLGWVLTDLYVTREDGRPFHCGLFESEAQLIESYEAAGGLRVSPRALIWHRIFCTWKQLILSLGCALRAGDGGTHQDVLLSWLAGGGYTLSEALRRLLEKHG